MSYWMMLRRKRLIASSGLNIAKLAITYSAEGGMTDEIVAMADGKYRLLTLTKSGTLNIPEEVIADVWLCGGGAHGVNHSSYGGYGGGGGFVASSYGLNVKEVVATVGAAAGATSFMDVSANGASGKNGGSGGGGNYWGSAGTGADVSTYPFEDTTYFSGKPHCAGGGGGGTYVNARYTNGGNGGSNGSAGSPGVKTSYDYYGGSGGLYGGGHGCSASSAHTSRNATFYGGGGGGRGAYAEEEFTSRGTGYQGVIYVRIPLKQ